MSLQDRIQHVEERIKAACDRSGHNRNDVNIVAVTKYVSVEMTQTVLDHGILHIGENRPQNAIPKWEALQGRGTWHFIGHLQSRKVKDVVGKFKYIHSLDRISLAEEVDKRAAASGIEVLAFVQVNVSGESTKQGLEPGEVEAFLQEMERYPHIKVIGLMTMAPVEEDPELTRPVFRRLRELRDELNTKKVTREPMTELSMGMSGDFEIAIEEGATWVRLGTILVGKGEEE
ncbi:MULTISPECIES: YggS family pyridoxal phosphate-dependent enzyme [unclassified Paenibacillus]|uniref:YggS family pyridoxal phosphate-dependent enzyme n=1 Tax=unclassified Paenibacillus TaxID=185978 RepID=UPI000839CAF4|nr:MULTISPECIES: YggS family pyridoxal phosphate-dependent enzyme [unclassified Paenibacillus]NWL86797.1 YggS family pyridoxal phosphate-dependent enzyme [Paenibacillus sp. 79R4]